MTARGTVATRSWSFTSTHIATPGSTGASIPAAVLPVKANSPRLWSFPFVRATALSRPGPLLAYTLPVKGYLKATWNFITYRFAKPVAQGNKIPGTQVPIPTRSSSPLGSVK